LSTSGEEDPTLTITQSNVTETVRVETLYTIQSSLNNRLHLVLSDAT